MNTFIAFCIALFTSISAFFVWTEPAAAPTHEESAPVSTIASIDRSNQGLTTLPKDILARTNIRSLNLSHNALEGSLPAEIRHFTQLETLDISYNAMTGIPAEVGQLSELRILNLAHNTFTGLPHEIGNLQKLEVLDLSGNAVSEQDLAIIRAKLPASTKIIR